MVVALKLRSWPRPKLNKTAIRWIVSLTYLNNPKNEDKPKKEVKTKKEDDPINEGPLQFKDRVHF